MPRPNKPLNEMTTDEIAALSPEDFKELAGDHNDQVELRENAQNQKDLASNVKDLDGPDNPLNYREQRRLMETDNRLTLEQRNAIRDHDNTPLTEAQQRDILKALEKPSGGYGYGRSVPDLPSPDKEVDELLDKLVEERAPERFGKPLIPAVIEAVKELPEAVRTKMNPFRPMLKWDREEDRERENSLQGERW